MKEGLQESIETLKADILRAEGQTREIKNAEREFSRIKKLGEEVSDKLGKFIGEKRRIDTMEEDFHRLVSISESVDTKLDQDLSFLINVVFVRQYLKGFVRKVPEATLVDLHLCIPARRTDPPGTYRRAALLTLPAHTDDIRMIAELRHLVDERVLLVHEKIEFCLGHLILLLPELRIESLDLGHTLADGPFPFGHHPSFQFDARSIGYAYHARPQGSTQ